MSKTELRLDLAILRDRGFHNAAWFNRLKRFVRHDAARVASPASWFPMFKKPSIRQWTQEEILRREA